MNAYIYSHANLVIGLIIIGMALSALYVFIRIYNELMPQLHERASQLNRQPLDE